jgi:hypothetical protein
MSLDPSSYGSRTRRSDQKFDMRRMFHSGHKIRNTHDSQNSQSESIRWFAPKGEPNSISFSKDQAIASCRTETTCGSANIPIDQISQPRDVIMVKNEIDIDVSCSERPGRKWLLKFADIKQNRFGSV